LWVVVAFASLRPSFDPFMCFFGVRAVSRDVTFVFAVKEAVLFPLILLLIFVPIFALDRSLAWPAACVYWCLLCGLLTLLA
jgi:hypothetical protein